MQMQVREMTARMEKQAFDFSKYLGECSEEVKKWPAWKQKVLG